MLTPYIFFNLIMGTIAALQRFTDVYLMSSPNGGPVDSTMIPVLYLFNNAFQYFKMGYASAWAWVLFVVIMSLTLLQLRGAHHWWDWLQTTRYIGVTATTSDPIVWRAIYNAGYLAIFGIPLNLAVGLALAMLLNARVRGMHFYRTVYYLPAITPVLAVAMIWPWILNPDSGVVNSVWRATLGHWFALPAPSWLAGEQWSKPAYLVMGLWGAGGAMILWLAGLQGIPQHLYEAADLDGAGPWHRLRHVTLPMLTPYLFFNLIMGTIASIQRFTEVYLISSPTGGPVDSTMVPVLYLFNNAFQYFKMGYASAWAWVLFLAILSLTLLQLRGAKRWVHYEGERGK